jgi:hypothetical protein
MHWHAYQWIGNGTDRANEGDRRPTSPHFLTNPLPPMRTGDWLAKSPSLIADTYEDVDVAVKWLSAEYGKASGSLMHPDRIELDARLEWAADALRLGVDVQWSEWLKGGRFLTLGLICCPNRHVSHPCPERR